MPDFIDYRIDDHVAVSPSTGRDDERFNRHMSATRASLPRRPSGPGGALRRPHGAGGVLPAMTSARSCLVSSARNRHALRDLSRSHARRRRGARMR